MFDGLPNLFFLLIPLAIFIGRMVFEARARRDRSPAQPKIPVHFEDEDDDEETERGFFLRNHAEHTPAAPVPSVPAKAPAAGALGAMFSASPAAIPPGAGAGLAAQPAPPPPPSPRGAPGLPPNIKRLPPLKQAVVMAEVLGPPKGLQ